jgi:hypothetical protein
MALERNLSPVPPVLLTADGTTEGVVTVATTCGFYVKQQAILQAPFILPLNVEIKRVVSDTILWVGPPNSKEMTHRIDVSAYTVAAGSFIYAVEQPKAVLAMESRLYASYIQEPSNSWKTSLVDCIGNLYGESNPLPVSFAGTIEISQVEVVGPTGNTLLPNPNGSINVNIIESPIPGSMVKSIYSEANSVASGATTTLVSYTVPGGLTTSILQRISVSGENIAKFTVFRNGTQIDTRRTFFGSSLSEYFEFTTGSVDGYALSPGDILLVKVLHVRPSIADFEGRIQVLEIA